MARISYESAAKLKTFTWEETKTWWAEGEALIPAGDVVEETNVEAFSAFIRKMPIVFMRAHHEGIELVGLAPAPGSTQHYLKAAMNFGGLHDRAVTMSDTHDALEFVYEQAR